MKPVDGGPAARRRQRRGAGPAARGGSASSELFERWPALGGRVRPMLARLSEHRDAPRWNHAAGDRLTKEDLRALDRFREELSALRHSWTAGPPSAPILQRIASLRERVPLFRERLKDTKDLEADWWRVPTMSREEIAVAAWELVPDDADLERMIVYRTAGTTGHALLVPHEPRAAASYQPLIEHALARHGVELRFGPDVVSCFLIGAQAHTVTYPTVLSAWNGAGFAKLNLRQSEWPSETSAQRYFRDMMPRLLTGDPISFSEMLRLEIPARPAALISTAVAMSAALRNKLRSAYECPVIDWYSLTETGPLAYLCRLGEGHHVLPHDVHVEALFSDGSPVPPGERGEIAVTGGRNPFLPLLRYRTGDYGRLECAPCECGDPTPRIFDLEGRAPVLLRAADGSAVNPVDLSRILRELPIVQHELRQHADLSCEIVIRALGTPPDREAIRDALRAALGDVRIEVRFDPQLGDRSEGKVVPYRSDFLLEDG